jgi:hypothetical protein
VTIASTSSASLSVSVVDPDSTGSVQSYSTRLTTGRS